MFRPPDQGHGCAGVPAHWGVLDKGEEEEFGALEEEDTLIDWNAVR